MACVLILGGVRTGYGPGGTVDMTFCHVSNVDWLRAPQSSVVRCTTWSIFWLNKPNLALFVCFFAFINLRQIFTTYILLICLDEMNRKSKKYYQNSNFLNKDKNKAKKQIFLFIFFFIQNICIFIIIFYFFGSSR